MVGGLVAEWYRPDGSEVAPGEPVCRLECDYVAVEIEAERGGVLRHRRPAGSIERKGAVLGVIVGPGEPLPPEEVLRAAEPREPARDQDAEAPAPVDGGRGAGPATSAPEVVANTEGANATEVDQATASPASRPPGAIQGAVVPFPRRDGAPTGRAEPLPEPGGAIPGLPLWEEDELDNVPEGEPRRPSATEPVPDADAAPRAEEAAGTTGTTGRFERIAAEAAAAAEVLSAQVCVSWTRAEEAVEALTDEWQPFGPRPRVEDLALRAIARALAEAGLKPGVAGMVVVEAEADRSYAVSEPLEEEFRAMVQSRADGSAPFERADWVVVSLLPIGVERLEPRLAGGRLAFGLGAGRDGTGTITMRYDSAMFGEGDAGRVLARVRSLVENPYRLWG
jgi:pyruvate/2-oxoglutarate dehydrogenase complex dihydrolipoamide acyltransferase (E2) component